MRAVRRVGVVRNTRRRAVRGSGYGGVVFGVREYKLNVTDLETGQFVLYEDKVHQVASTPQSRSKGRQISSVEVKLKEVVTEKYKPMKLRPQETLEVIEVLRLPARFIGTEEDDEGDEEYQFVYEGEEEPFNIDVSRLEGKHDFLKPGIRLFVRSYEGTVLKVDWPSNVVMKVAKEESFTSGGADAVTKKVELENGAIMRVPHFVKAGELIKVRLQDSIEYWKNPDADDLATNQEYAKWYSEFRKTEDEDEEEEEEDDEEEEKEKS
eukprot:TRINITY_DN494_c0_g1_i1.p1 TRINITY_DN494_c0_g1~~TRINITY_DN494_c0_g1_i1.p1  ORF type:complete len:266 (+),score=79.74 TRINITY_DN494_c0_g1_i1:3-800(+)